MGAPIKLFGESQRNRGDWLQNKPNSIGNEENDKLFR